MFRSKRIRVRSVDILLVTVWLAYCLPFRRRTRLLWFLVSSICRCCIWSCLLSVAAVWSDRWARERWNSRFLLVFCGYFVVCVCNFFDWLSTCMQSYAFDCIFIHKYSEMRHYSHSKIVFMRLIAYSFINIVRCVTILIQKT